MSEFVYVTSYYYGADAAALDCANASGAEIYGRGTDKIVEVAVRRTFPDGSNTAPDFGAALTEHISRQVDCVFSASHRIVLSAEEEEEEGLVSRGRVPAPHRKNRLAVRVGVRATRQTTQVR